MPYCLISFPSRIVQACCVVWLPWTQHRSRGGQRRRSREEKEEEEEEEEDDDDDDEEYAEATPLGVSYEKRETVKALGAWWNAATRTWMAPQGADRKVFAPWIRVAGSKRYLCHPFSKNDEVKREVGARFDGSRRMWYIPEECLCARNLDYCRSRGWLA